MDTDILIEKFAKMGARAKLNEPVRRRWGRTQFAAISIDIGQDRKGEFFSVMMNPERLDECRVTDVRPAQRHLLLQVDHRDADEGRQKFLCGHDERHWFVAAVPEAARASNVQTAMQALKPIAVKAAEARVRLKARDGQRRKNRAFIRQGEWFFIPCPGVSFNADLIHQREPLSRGAGSKPHIVDEIVRTGGETVYVSYLHPTGLTEAERKRWVSRNRAKARGVRFQAMVRNAGVFARGKVRHADHKTIVLNGWHEVAMNTESQSRAMSHVAFLD
ncbi:MAG: hypothetical protein AAGA25_15120 [Planctomycetota bacterium]